MKAILHGRILLPDCEVRDKALLYDEKIVGLVDEDAARAQAGELIEMWFNEPYVKDITGLRVIKFGETIEAALDCAAVVNYERASSADKEPVMNGWYSFTERTILMGTPTTMEATGTMIASELVKESPISPSSQAIFA